MMFFTVVDEFLYLYPGEFFLDGQVLVDSGDVVIGCSDDLSGAEDLYSSLFESLEGLGAGDFVNKMLVDVQDRGAAFYSADDVAVPDLFK